MKYISIIFIMFALTGCVATSAIPKDYKGPTSLIWDDIQPLSKNKAYIFEAIAVDGRQIKSSSAASADKRFDGGLRTQATGLARQVPSQTKTLKIRAIPHTAMIFAGLPDSLASIYGTVNVELEPDRAYEVSGEIHDEYSLIWLQEEQTKIIVSSVIMKGDVTENIINTIKRTRIDNNQRRLENLAKQQLELSQRKNEALIRYNQGFCKKAASENETAAYFDVAETLYKNKLGDFGLDCLLKIAALKNTPEQAFQYLALIYDLGLGVTENPQQAAYWRAQRTNKTP